MTMEIIPAPEDRVAYAEYLIERTNRGTSDAAAAILELRDGNYWHDLGYSTFAACAADRVHVSRSQAYKLLAQAMITAMHGAGVTIEKPKQLQNNRERAERRQLFAPKAAAAMATNMTPPSLINETIRHNAPTPPMAEPRRVEVVPDAPAPGVTVSLLPQRFPSGFVSCTIAADGRGYRLRLARRGLAIQDDWYGSPDAGLAALARVFAGE